MIVSFAILILTIVALILFGYIIYLKIFKRYTRERFAFFSVSMFSSLCITIILQIYSGQAYLSVYYNTANLFFGASYSPYVADWKDHIITVIILALFYRNISQLFKNWNGPTSTLDYQKQRMSIDPTMHYYFYLQLRDFLKKEKIIKPYDEDSLAEKINVFSNINQERIPWHEQVVELLSLSSRQYKIHSKTDYYSDEKVFISKYGINNDYIAILAVYDYPKESAIKKFLAFCKQKKKTFLKIIIAVKNEDRESFTKEFFGQVINFRFEQELLGSLVDFSSYTQFISAQFTKNEVYSGSKIFLNDIYVELSAHTEDKRTIKGVESYIETWLNDDHDNRHLAILGEYGCGKSVLSLKITYDLLKVRTPQSRIPILIELRGKSPRNLTVEELLSTWAISFRLEAAAILKLHQAGKLLIIFEGFDEMDMVGDREVRLNHFQRLWEFAIPKSKIIITGRPNFFLDDKELKANLGINRPFQSSHYCEAVYLNKFNKEQVQAALRNIDVNTRNQVLEIVQRDNQLSFFDLVSRPAILTLVALIWKERKLSEIKDSINSAIVISEFIKFSYSRQESKKASFPLTEKEREYFMLGIAAAMVQNNDFSNQIYKNDLQEIVRKLYNGFPINLEAGDSATQVGRASLKKRMADNHQAEDTVITDVRSCGILVLDLTRKDYFKFAHKSFLEYQISQCYVESLLQDKGMYNLIVNAIRKALDYNFTFFHSKETIQFTAEILINKLELKKEQNSTKTCKELFHLLFPIQMIGRYPRLASFLDIYSQPLLFLSFPVFLILLIIFNGPNSLPSNDKITIFLTSVISFVMASLYNKHRGNIYRRTSVWLECCRQLGIADSEISNVVFKGYVKFIDSKSRDAFSMLLKKVLQLTFEKEIKQTTQELRKNQNLVSEPDIEVLDAKIK